MDRIEKLKKYLKIKASLGVITTGVMASSLTGCNFNENDLVELLDETYVGYLADKVEFYTVDKHYDTDKDGKQIEHTVYTKIADGSKIYEDFYMDCQLYNENVPSEDRVYYHEYVGVIDPITEYMTEKEKEKQKNNSLTNSDFIRICKRAKRKNKSECEFRLKSITRAGIPSLGHDSKKRVLKF